MTQKTTILIVDDDPVAREILEALLRGQGYHLSLAKNGLDGLNKASELIPDLILLDVMMPEMDGFEVCQRLRSDPILAQVPIIMVTGLEDRDSRLRGFKMGADDFISKPFDRTELRTRVRTIAQLNRYRQLLEERANLEQAHQELAQAYESTLEGWARALELRDAETKGHCMRVTEMTEDLARDIGINEDKLVHVRRGALLHDIGKMGIPDSILLKPGPLDEQEWALMRQHTNYAYDMLYPIPYLRPALDIPYYHHEKWDGSGYPQGLRGEQIPLEARIFAVIDVWDALISDRPYRLAWSKEKARKHIQEQSGAHFDPKIVEIFFSRYG